MTVKAPINNLHVSCAFILNDSKDTKRFTHIGVEVIQAAAQLPGVRGEAW